MSTPHGPTPTSLPHHHQHQRSRSRSRAHSSGDSPPARPTTPLRPPSRTSLRSSSRTPTTSAQGTNPLQALEPAFADLSDSMADLEANFVHLQLMHESLSRFNESFASFLYGCNVNAFCVDFPEAPISESFRRARENPAFNQPESGFGDSVRMGGGYGGGYGGPGRGREDAGQEDQTFLTNETSFVDNPPSARKPATAKDASSFMTPNKRGQSGGQGRGARGGAGRGVGRGDAASGRGGTAAGRGRASGLARASGRGRGRGL